MPARRSSLRSLFQGKTVIQAEIDAAAELIDFFRFNAKYAVELESSQPLSVPPSTNSMVYRGLEVRRGWGASDVRLQGVEGLRGHGSGRTLCACGRAELSLCLVSRGGCFPSLLRPLLGCA